MGVKVSFLAHLRNLVGGPSVELDTNPATLRDVIKELGTRYGSQVTDEVLEDGEVSDLVVILKNGNITYDLDQKIEDGDEITILPPAFGG
jgi:MoaD family protein